MALRPIAVSVVLAAALLARTCSTTGARRSSTARSPASRSRHRALPGQRVRRVRHGGPDKLPLAGLGGHVAREQLAAHPPVGRPGRPAVIPDGPVTAADRFAIWNHGARTAKLVALTFDDGWNLTDLRKIVAILEAKEAPATFFPVGRAVLRHPGTWRSVAALGFPIGNHSWNHDDLSRGPASKALKDINRATRAIERTTGVDLFPAIRPPFGTYDASFRKAARAAGMRAVIMWDVDPRDWSGIRPRAVVKGALAARRGSIIVMHTDKMNIVHALPKIIDGLRAKGFKLVTVGQLIGLPGPVPIFVDREQREFQNGR